MAELNGGQIIAKQLKAEGIDTVFGVLAGPMIQALAGLQEEGIRYIGCRHEENAAFAAAAWGYQKKKPGVCIVGSGPAATNAVTSMYVSTESGMPLIVLGGSVSGLNRGIGGFQEVDQVAFAAPGCKWAIQVDSTERIPDYIRIAAGKAVNGRPGAVYLDFPGNLISNKVEESTVRYRTPAGEPAALHPDPAGVDKVAEMLAAAERPLILVGKGAGWADASSSLTRLVDRGIPFVASPMGRGTVPDDNDHFMNGARSAAMKGADAVFMVGGRYNWIFQFGRGGRFTEGTRFAQVDIVPEELTSAIDPEIGLVGDCAIAVDQVADALEGHTLASAGSGWLDGLKTDRMKNEAALAESMDSDRQPINHFRLLREVRDALDRDAAVAVDGELTMGVARATLPSFGPRLRMNSGTTGCMGTGVPYAIGAKAARPDSQAVAVVGDYAFGTAGIEVETCMRKGLPVVFVVSNNGGIAGHTIQDNMFPPDSAPFGVLTQPDYEKMAEMVGGFARKITDPADIQPALKEALSSGKVSVLNVLTDPKGRRSGSAYLG